MIDNGYPPAGCAKVSSQEQLDARAFLKDHFKTMAKYGANA